MFPNGASLLWQGRGCSSPVHLEGQLGEEVSSGWLGQVRSGEQRPSQAAPRAGRCE